MEMGETVDGVSVESGDEAKVMVESVDPKDVGVRKAMDGVAAELLVEPQVLPEVALP